MACDFPYFLLYPFTFHYFLFTPYSVLHPCTRLFYSPIHLLNIHRQFEFHFIIYMPLTLYMDLPTFLKIIPRFTLFKFLMNEPYMWTTHAYINPFYLLKFLIFSQTMFYLINCQPYTRFIFNLLRSRIYLFYSLNYTNIFCSPGGLWILK